MLRSLAIIGAAAATVCGCGQTAVTSAPAIPQSRAVATPSQSASRAAARQVCPSPTITPAAAPAPVGEHPAPAGEITASIPIKYAPGSLTVSDGSVWVVAHRSNTVFRIDPSTNAVAASIPFDQSDGIGPVSAGLHGLWVPATDQQAHRIDPATNTVVQSVSVQNHDGASGDLHLDKALDLIDTPSGLWLGVSQPNPAVVRVDPATGKIVRTVATGPSDHALAMAAGSLWVLSFADTSGRVDETSTRFQRIDPATGAVIAEIALPGVPAGLAAGDDGVYVAMHDYSVARIDPATNCVAAVAFLGHTADAQSAPFSDPITICDQAGTLYLGFDRGAIAVADAHTLTVRTALRVDTQDYQGDVVAAFGSLWLAGFSTDTLYRLRVPA